jgi:predicted histone-like DNA-binding protein
MALIYKAFQSNLMDKQGRKLYFPRLVKAGAPVSTQKIAGLIAERSSLSAGDVHNVIRNLMSVMREQLLNSKSVHLEGLGIFSMVVHANGAGVETAEEVSSRRITRLRCRFCGIHDGTRQRDHAGDERRRRVCEGGQTDR